MEHVHTNLHDDASVVIIDIQRVDVRRALMDNESFANILVYDIIRKMNPCASQLDQATRLLLGFVGGFVTSHHPA